MLTALHLEQLMQSTVNYFKNEGLEDNDMSHISKIYLCFWSNDFDTYLCILWTGIKLNDGARA